MTHNMTPDSTDPRDARAVYDRDAGDFRQRAPELTTYKWIVAPAIRTYLNRYLPRGRESTLVLDAGSASGRNEHLLIDEGFQA